MTLEELKEHIKNEVVLREGDLFTWQWQQLGLLAEAEKLGLAENEFLGLVNEVSRNINPFFGRISDLKINIAALAQLHNNRLTDTQISQFVEQAQPLQLSASFIRNRWIPAILIALPELKSDLVSTSTAFSSPTPTQDSPEPNIERQDDPAKGVMMKQVRSVLDNKHGHIPTTLLKELFLSTDYDQTQLAKLIEGYLTVHGYIAKTIPQGKTLTQQLLSTDWYIPESVTTETSPIAKQPNIPNQTSTDQSANQGSGRVIVLVSAALIGSLLLINAFTSKPTYKPTVEPGYSTETELNADSIMSSDTTQMVNYADSTATMASDSAATMSSDSAK